MSIAATARCMALALALWINLFFITGSHVGNDYIFDFSCEGDVVRGTQERERFRQFIQAIFWVKRVTGKPSSEVINAVMRNYRGSFSEIISSRAGTV